MSRDDVDVGSFGSDTIVTMRWGKAEVSLSVREWMRRATGSKNGRLSPREAAEIRVAHEKGISAAVLGRRFGISARQVFRICAGDVFPEVSVIKSSV